MTNRRFDTKAFYAALDATRQAKHMTWVAVADAAGVSCALLTRLKHGNPPAAEGLVALCRWSGLNPVQFLTGDVEAADVEAGAAVVAEPIAVALEALRADPNLSPQARATITAVLRATYEQLAVPA
jgi:transcriptional regulator with XRE-family HTH domain